MAKFHHVQALEFEGNDLILKVDNQVPRIPIREISPQLAQAKDFSDRYSCNCKIQSLSPH